MEGLPIEKIMLFLSEVCLGGLVNSILGRCYIY